MVTQVPIKSRKDECFQKLFKCTSSIYHIKRVQCIGHFQKKECWLIHVQYYPAWQESCQVGFIKVNITSRPTVPTAKRPGLKPQPCLLGKQWGSPLTPTWPIPPPACHSELLTSMADRVSVLFRKDPLHQCVFVLALVKPGKGDGLFFHKSAPNAPNERHSHWEMTKGSKDTKSLWLIKTSKCHVPQAFL